MRRLDFDDRATRRRQSAEYEPVLDAATVAGMRTFSQTLTIVIGLCSNELGLHIAASTDALGQSQTDRLGRRRSALGLSSATIISCVCTRPFASCQLELKSLLHLDSRGQRLLETQTTPKSRAEDALSGLCCYKRATGHGLDPIPTGRDEPEVVIC